MRKSGRNYSAEGKTSIIKRHLLVKESVSNICDDIGTAPTQFYRWRKEFLDKIGKKTIVDYFIPNPFEGCRCLTYMMMDEDIFAVSPVRGIQDAQIQGFDGAAHG